MVRLQPTTKEVALTQLADHVWVAQTLCRAITGQARPRRMVTARYTLASPSSNLVRQPGEIEVEEP
jgi:hypothetical protein